MKLKVIELFGGIGACSKALERLNIEHEVVDYVEIDKYAAKSYNAIHGTNFEPQDITQWDKDIEVDLIMHGSPCQDFSLAGKQAGGNKNSGTRSSLMYETIRIVEKLSPKYVIWENVKNVISKKHRHNFDNYLQEMESLGYTNYWQVLNAKDYGIPQNRERVFVVSILGEHKDFEFPLKDINENKVISFGVENNQGKIHQQDLIQDEDGICRTIPAGTHGSTSHLLKTVVRNFEFPKGEDCDNSIKVVGNYMPSGHDASRVVDENGLAPTVKENHGTVTAVLQRFEFPPKQELKLKLKDMLEDEVDEKYYLSNKMIDYVMASGTKTFYYKPEIDLEIARPLSTDQNKRSGTTNYFSEQFLKSGEKFLIKEATKQGYKEAYEGDSINISSRMEYQRGNVQKESIQTITTSGGSDRGVVTNDLRIRKLTPKECFRLMGFDDDDFEKASKVNSNSQLYKQAGNSIVVNVLEAILINLLNKY